MCFLWRLALLFFMSATALACFQTEHPVGILHGDRVAGVITLDRRPIIEAKLELHSLSGDPARDKRVLADTTTSPEGAFDFGAQHAGGYMIVMTTPSYERIPVQVVAASPQRSVEALAVRFTADFCLSIGVTSNIPAK
jgi:hypothetical protein